MHALVESSTDFYEALSLIKSLRDRGSTARH